MPCPLCGRPYRGRGPCFVCIYRERQAPPEPCRPRLPDLLEASRRRIAFTRQLRAESRFLDQRTEAAHRSFLKILDRVCPLDDSLAAQPEPLPELAPSNPARPVPPGSHPWNYASRALRQDTSPSTPRIAGVKAGCGET